MRRRQNGLSNTLAERHIENLIFSTRGRPRFRAVEAGLLGRGGYSHRVVSEDVTHSSYVARRFKGRRRLALPVCLVHE